MIHLACPLPTQADPETIFQVRQNMRSIYRVGVDYQTIQVSEKGTLNVIQQALKAGVKHISVASSVGSAINFGDFTAKLTENGI